MQDYRKTGSVWINEKLWNWAREYRVPLSQITERVLKFLHAFGSWDDEEIKLAILVVLRERLDEEIKEQQATVDEIRRSREVARLIKMLNEKIVSCEFNLDSVKVEATKEIEDLRSIFTFPLDDQWLRRQIDRVARLVPGR